MKKVLVVGAGFAGAVVARELAEANYEILVIEKKPHIGGNCYTKKDSETGIMEHVYGPHIFNTSNIDVWKYINKYGELLPFINRVKCSVKDQIYSFPINLHTINQFFKKNFSPNEARIFIDKIRNKEFKNPRNFEEQALSFIGEDLYKSFFYGYTIKQWGCEPRELPASILKRIPIRFNYDDNYYNKKFQGIPKFGYTKIIENILKHKKIKLEKNLSWQNKMKSDFDKIFFSGPIDEFFGFRFGRLGYRTVFWEKNVVSGDFQGTAGINYPDIDVEFTRIYEHKHFTPWETFDKSIVLKEFSKETGVNDIPYYPKRLAKDLQILSKYQLEAEKEKNIEFIGRLGTYKYMNMEDVIFESLNISRNFLESEVNL